MGVGVELGVGLEVLRYMGVNKRCTRRGAGTSSAGLGIYEEKFQGV